MLYNLDLFVCLSMEVGSKRKEGAVRRALEKFAATGARNDVEREAILSSIFANKVCDFLDDKFGNLSAEVVWRWVIVEGRDGKEDICCGFKIDEKEDTSEVGFQIAKFYEESLEGSEWWGYEGTHFFVLVSPERPDPSSFRPEPGCYIIIPPRLKAPKSRGHIRRQMSVLKKCRSYKRSRCRGDESEAFERGEVKDETDPGPNRRGRKRRGGVSSGSPHKKTTSLGGEAENV